MSVTGDPGPGGSIQSRFMGLVAGVVITLIALASLAWNLERTLLPSYQNEKEAWGDFTSYYMAGYCADKGINFYDHRLIMKEAHRMGSPKGGAPRFIYPPFAALLFIPLAKVMGPVSAYRAFVVFSQVLYWASVFIMFRIIGFRPTLFKVALTVIAASWFTPAWNTLQSGQINMVMLFLLCIAFLALLRGKAAWSGFVLAIAASIKIIPGIALLYFALRKRWSGILGMVVTGLTLLALSIAFFGFALHRNYVMEVVPERAAVIATGNFNVALNSFVYRTIHHKGLNKEIISRSEIGRQTTRAGTALLLLASVLLMLFPRRDTAEIGLQRVSLLLITAMTISTITWTHHLVMALPCLAVVGHGIRNRHHTVLGPAQLFSALSFFLLAISYRLQPFKNLSGLPFELMRSSSLNMYGLLIIWMLLAAGIVNSRSRGPEWDFRQTG